MRADSGVKYLSKPYLPVETDQITRSFPANVYELMPSWESIPQEFRQRRSDWNKFFGEWMYKGMPDTAEFTAKDGISAETAYWHLYCVIGSYQPKHEHKEAAVAYLASLWFDRVYFDEKHVWGDKP